MTYNLPLLIVVAIVLQCVIFHLQTLILEQGRNIMSTATTSAQALSDLQAVAQSIQDSVTALNATDQQLGQAIDLLTKLVQNSQSGQGIDPNSVEAVVTLLKQSQTNIQTVNANVTSQNTGVGAVNAKLSPAPTIASISPTSGDVSGGGSVQVNGAGFQQGAGLTLGGTAVNPVTVSADGSTITGTAPAATSPGPEDVVVTNPDGQSATLTGGYTYTTTAAATTTGTADNPIAATRARKS
jgi:hypothetical protein